MTLTNSEFTRQYLIWRENRSEDYSVERFETEIRMTRNEQVRLDVLDVLCAVRNEWLAEKALDPSVWELRFRQAVGTAIAMLEGNVEA